MSATLFGGLTLSQWNHFAYTVQKLELIFTLHPEDTLYSLTNGTRVQKPRSLCHYLKQILGYNIYAGISCGIRLNLPSIKLDWKWHLAWLLPLWYFYPFNIGFFWKHSFTNNFQENSYLKVCSSKPI